MLTSDTPSASDVKHVFPECVAKGSRFTFWGSGIGGVFAGCRFGVRNRLRAAVVAESCRRAYGKSHFGGFKCDVASFRVTGVALCDMWMRDRGGRK